MGEQPRLPVFLLTGFLGSGKATLLNSVLPRYADSALVINELGDIGIDDQLIEDRSLPVTLLAGGCVCCTVRGSLGSTLRNLWMSRRSGALPPFSRVIIETTGAADPWGVVESLMRDSFLQRHYVLASVLTTVDAERGLEGLLKFPEVIEQVLVADTLLMSRADRVSAAQLETLQASLSRLNPNAVTRAIQPGQVPDGLLDDQAQARCRYTGLAINNGARLVPMVAAAGGMVMQGATATKAHANSTIQSASLRLPQPLEQWQLMRVLEQWLGENARYLLRFKGLFHIAGEPGPLLVQAVSYGMDEPRLLPQWPDEDHGSRMVLIIHHPSAEMAQALLEKLAVHLSGESPAIEHL